MNIIRKCPYGSTQQNNELEQSNETSGLTRARYNYSVNFFEVDMLRYYIFVIFLLPLILLAQNSLQYLSATTGAACQVVEYDNGYLYTGCGSTFRVYRVFQRDSPPFDDVFEYRFRSRINDICIFKGCLYICANHDGLSKWDLNDPEQPVKVAEYIPETDDLAVHEVNFFGDSLIVSEEARVSLFREKLSGNSERFEPIGVLEIPMQKSLVCGGAIKGSMFAAIAGMGGASDGVYIYDLKSGGMLSFVPITFSDPEDAFFGLNNNLLHILGGTRSTHNPFDPRGLFCSLDVSDPTVPKMVYADTLRGMTGVAIASPMNGVNINDTLYVATTAALRPEQNIPDCAYIYVYDATDPSHVKPLTYLPAGLWHFDVDKGGNRLFIASEWYGIKTIDITDIYSPLDLGNTLTGGWNTGGDVYENTLLVANEGYGFKKYDISDPFFPQPVGTSTRGTFCQDCKFSSDGNYIFAQYSTGKGFVVYNSRTLLPVDSLDIVLGDGPMLVWENRIFCVSNNLAGDNLYIIDVSHPTAVSLEKTVSLTVNDFFARDNKLYIGNDDGLFVYDISNGNFELLAQIKLTWLNSIKNIAVYKDTVFTFITGLGFEKLICYEGLKNNGNYNLRQWYEAELPHGLPQKMVADEHGLYLAYTKHGLFSYDKKTIRQTGYMRTGLAFKGFSDRFGVRELYCRNDRIYLVEYFGQTSIYSIEGKTSVMTYGEKSRSIPSEIFLYPNPASHFLNIRCNMPVNSFRVLNILGQTVLTRSLTGASPFVLETRGLPNGVYWIQVTTPFSVLSKKMTISR
ncbi:T9SS type A sorting domain-containing protein [candidate division KSB1 bacterium]|nr:T9SS type A sorting domain-containing protein [candidate division KSB1 bacterium]